MKKLFLILSLFQVFFLFCFKNDNSEQYTSNKENKKDSIPIEYRNCIVELSLKDSILTSYLNNVNKNWNRPSSGFINPGCLNSVRIDNSDKKSIAAFLVNEISNKKKGKGYRASLLFDLQKITCHKVKPQFYKHGLVVFDDDSTENYVIKNWKKWWDDNKTFTYLEWNINALNNEEYSKYNVSVAISNLSELNDSLVVPHLINRIDTTIFFNHNNYNSMLVGALVKLKAKEIIPFIIKYYLSASPKYVREDGIKYLEKLTGETLDYKPLSSKKMRLAAIKRWWEYWEKVKSELEIVKSEIN